MSRGPGKLQRDILRVVGEHGPIEVEALITLIEGEIEQEWVTGEGMVREAVREIVGGESTGPSDYEVLAEAVRRIKRGAPLLPQGEWRRTTHCLTRRRACRRSIDSLLASGRLVWAPAESRAQTWTVKTTGGTRYYATSDPDTTQLRIRKSEGDRLAGWHYGPAKVTLP